jgi:hypothetical protein
MDDGAETRLLRRLRLLAMTLLGFLAMPCGVIASLVPAGRPTRPL